MASRRDVGNSIDIRKVIEIAQGEEPDFKPGRHQNHHAYNISRIKGNNYLRYRESKTVNEPIEMPLYLTSSKAIGNDDYIIQNGEWESAYNYDSSGNVIEDSTFVSYYNNNSVKGDWIQLNNYHLSDKTDNNLIGYGMKVKCSCRRKPNNITLLGSFENDFNSDNSNAVLINNSQLEYRNSVAIIDMNYDNTLFNYYRLVINDISNPEVLSSGAPVTISEMSFFPFIKSSAFSCVLFIIDI